MDKGFDKAHNLLDSNEELKYASLHSFSQEEAHKNDLILVLQGREVWRISAAPTEDNPYGMKKTRLFKL